MRSCAFLLGVLAALPAWADGAPPQGFSDWLAAFRTEAAAQGIAAATLDAALADVQPLPRVIELDRRQPEFLQTFADYQSRRVTPAQVARGQALLAEHAALFDAVETRFGVPRAVLAAFWGLETGYGRTLGSFNIPAALATLAWDGRRSAFFRAQLVDALRIVEAGHVAPAAMNGSWAGAMGHLQFMPSTFRAYALDGDGDGRIDPWNSLPDAMVSAANYLRRAGWRPGEPVALEVRLPENFDWRLARESYRVALADWIARGVTLADGAAWPAVSGPAAIVLPQGWRGPAFMVFDNFDVVMQWNRSLNYALAVAQLARQLAGGPPPVSPPGETGALSTAQVQILQRQLNELGYMAGVPDGVIGPRTQSALRRFQAANQLPADGYPGPAVAAKLNAVHAEAAGTGKLSLAPAAPAAF
ncbi:MAG: lytic murein transglycosylase, partial [Thiobacillus sp.]|nr:lytic murein transglycosylase [Thiobacillus sp.]